MEIFEVEYDGKKIPVQKDDDGSIYVLLPTRYGDRGSAFRETILHEQRGWRFTSTQEDDIEYYFHMWLKDDGRIAWTNDMMHGIDETREPFNPHYPNVGVLNDSALKLYSIVQQIKEYQKRDLPATELFLLRQFYLTSALKTLGYDSVEDVIENRNAGRGYLGLNLIASQLENYRDLSRLIVAMGEIRGKETFLSIAPKNMDRKKVLELAMPVKEQIEANVQFMQKQEDGLEKRRAVVPGYRTGLEDKMGVYTYDNYERAVRNAAILILELNSDLLTPEQREKLGIKEIIQLDELSLKDRISRLIDSKEFNDACKAESELAFEESKSVITKAKELQKSGARTSADLSRLIAEEISVAEGRKKSLENHERYDPYNKGKPKGYSLDDDN